MLNKVTMEDEARKLFSGLQASAEKDVQEAGKVGNSALANQRDTLRSAQNHDGAGFEALIKGEYATALKEFRETESVYRHSIKLTKFPGLWARTSTPWVIQTLEVVSSEPLRMNLTTVHPRRTSGNSTRCQSKCARLTDSNRHFAPNRSAPNAPNWVQCGVLRSIKLATLSCRALRDASWT
jgi:hypothetical protein